MWTIVIAVSVHSAVIVTWAFTFDTHCPCCGAWMSRRAYYCRCCGGASR